MIRGAVHLVHLDGTQEDGDKGKEDYEEWDLEGWKAC